MTTRVFNFGIYTVRAVATDTTVVLALTDICKVMGFNPTGTTTLSRVLPSSSIHRDSIIEGPNNLLGVDLDGTTDLMKYFRRNGKASKAAAFQHFLNNTLIPAMTPASEEKSAYSACALSSCNLEVVKLLLSNTLSATEGLVQANIRMALELLGKTET